MELFYREYGEGKPIIIAHGLFAMSDNWVRVAKQLSAKYKVYLLDLRNHGQSPHTQTHTYNSLANDFNDFLTEKKIEKAFFIGHSMGGKAVMQFANNYPEKLLKMLIVDISPRAYLHDNEFVKRTINHKKLLKVLKETNLNKFKNRKEIITYFAEYFNNIFILQLIQKNITRNKEGNFLRKINVEVLQNHLPKIISEIKINEHSRNIETLFIFGENSPYYKKEDIELIQKTFKNVKIELIKNAGHLLHIEQEDKFIETVVNFLK